MLALSGAMGPCAMGPKGPKVSLELNNGSLIHMAQWSEGSLRIPILFKKILSFLYPKKLFYQSNI